MSDSEDSMVTYTKAPPSPDYVSGPEYPPSPVYVLYVSEPIYPEFMPPEEYVLPAEEQPLPAAVLPTADSPGYITESDPEEDLEEDDEDPKEDPADYPDDRDDGEEGEEESSGHNVDDDEKDKDEDEEEEEHLAPADSVPPPIHRSSYPLGYRAAMIQLRAESSSTSHLLPLPSSIVLPHTRESVAMIRAAAPSTYILASRSKTPPSGTPPLLLIPLPTPSPPLLLPSTDYRAGVSEVTLPPRKRLCIALGLRFEVGESSSAPTTRPTGGFRVDYRFVGTLDDEIRQDPEIEVGYGITDTWDEMVEDMQGIPAATDMARLIQRMTHFITTIRQDTDEIYGRLDNVQDDRLLISSQLNMLRRDKRAHARTARLMKTEARLSHEAWVQSMDASDTARSETQVTVLQSQQGPASGLARPEIPKEAGSSS
ncbi:hypothetical protein Tco_1006208 [Tanacetum coccineum]|uniref:Uncharacterized protein n=1 Tax=Tanacetum coccineum TaxID=301880 RepID=A0ABQ5FH51_9ASTR